MTSVLLERRMWFVKRTYIYKCRFREVSGWFRMCVVVSKKSVKSELKWWSWQDYQWSTSPWWYFDDQCELEEDLVNLRDISWWTGALTHCPSVRKWRATKALEFSLIKERTSEHFKLLLHIYSAWFVCSFGVFSPFGRASCGSWQLLSLILFNGMFDRVGVTSALGSIDLEFNLLCWFSCIKSAGQSSHSTGIRPLFRNKYLLHR